MPKKLNPKARYPHWTKKFRTTIWKSTAIRFKKDHLELSNGQGNPKITIVLPVDLQNVLNFQEVRLVFDKRARVYVWHMVVENGKQPKTPEFNHTVSVDLGEIHPAVVGDEQEATIILCRERRHEAQGHAKRLATLASALSRKTKGSKRYKRLVRSKSRMKAKHQRVIRDIEHKVSRTIVDVAVERQANTIAIGDIRNIADGVDLGKRPIRKSAAGVMAKSGGWLSTKPKPKALPLFWSMNAIPARRVLTVVNNINPGARLSLPDLRVSVAP